MNRHIVRNKAMIRPRVKHGRHLNSVRCQAVYLVQHTENAVISRLQTVRYIMPMVHVNNVTVCIIRQEMV